MRATVALSLALGMAVIACGADAPPPPELPPAPTPQLKVVPPPAPTATAAVPATIPPPPPPPPVAMEVPPVPPPDPTLGAAVLEGNSLKIPAPVVFQEGSDQLSIQSDKVLFVLKEFLDQNRNLSLLRVEGHTDSDGTPESNLVLSQKRALAVATWLVKHGVDCKRLLAVGFGEARPLVPNTSSENKAKNRRTAFVQASLNGKPVKPGALGDGGTAAGDVCK